jgi:hypothetical protein
VDYLDPWRVRESHRVLRRWSLAPAAVALQLLSARVADRHARAFAVRSLSSLADTHLAPLLLQLVQVRVLV